MLDPVLLASYNAVRTTPNKSVFCHAPFANMNFAQNGDVTVCCYNRTYVLGSYPKDRIDDIWHGTAARDLRAAMARNDLPRGCDICMSQFESANFAGLRARSFDDLSEDRYAIADGVPFAYPKLLEFEISNVCNLECTMCTGFFSSSIRHNREHLPPIKTPYDDAFVRQLEPFVPHLKAARFLGGEPFLIRTYYQIWDMFVRMNPDIEISITTNATILNNRVKGILDRLRAHVIVSLDSLERENYERIRVNANHDEVMRNLEYFGEYTRRQGTTLSLAVCPMRQNWRELPALVEFCNKNGYQIFFNTVVYPGDATLQYMTPGQLDEVIGYLQNAQPQDRPGKSRENRAQFNDLIRQIISYRDWRRSLSASEGIRLGKWRLSVNSAECLPDPVDQGPSQTVMVRKADFPGLIRVVSDPVGIVSDSRYMLRFSARAQGAQRLTVAVGGAFPLWDPAGFYLEFGLSEVWETFEVDFVPKNVEPDGRIFFEVGQAEPDVEITDVSLRVLPHQPAGELVT